MHKEKTKLVWWTWAAKGLTSTGSLNAMASIVILPKHSPRACMYIRVRALALKHGRQIYKQTHTMGVDALGMMDGAPHYHNIQRLKDNVSYQRLTTAAIAFSGHR